VHTSSAIPGPLAWRGAPWLAIGLLAVVVARVTELFSPLAALRLALVGSAVVVLVLMLKANVATWRWLSRLTTTRLLCAYMAWSAVTVPFALWPGLGFTTLRIMLPLMVMYLAIVMCRPSWVNLDKIQLGLVFALAAFAAGSLLRGEQVVNGRLSPLGATYDTNDMAAVMAVGFTLAAGLARRARGVLRLLLAAAALLAASAVLASASRGGALALGVGTVVFVAGQRARRRVIYVASLALAVIVVWQRSGPVFRERLASLLALSDDYNARLSTGRVAVWKRGISYFVEHPVLGVGAGNFEVAEGQWLAANGSYGKWSASHNAYIQAFADLGVVGGVLFLSLIGVTASRARRMWSAKVSDGAEQAHRPELLAALAAFCVAALFLSLAYSGILIALAGLTTLATGAARAEHAFHRRSPPSQPASDVTTVTPAASLRSGGAGSSGTARRLRVAALVATEHVSGPGRQLTALAEYAAAAGAELLVVVFHRRGRPAPELARHLSERGVPHHIVEDRGPLDWRLVVEIGRLLAGWQPDIVQTHTFKATAVAFALRALGASWKWVGCFHGLTNENRKTRFYHWVDRRLLRWADRVVVVSQEQVRHFAHCGDRVRVVPNATLRLPAPHDPDEHARLHTLLQRLPRPLIGVVGRLSPEKGVDVFLAACAQLAFRRPAFSVIIAGDGAEQQRLKALTRRLSLERRVLFLSHVRNVGAVYDNLDLLVLPSRSEGLPNALLEGLQTDVPIVATRVGAIPDVIGSSPAALLVPAESVDALTDAMDAALTTGATPTARAARDEIARRYSVSRRVADHLSIYQDVLHGSVAREASVLAH
jgi:glycosyltransferase involved in cell wall biosynthesis/O-antigen ligase